MDNSWKHTVPGKIESETTGTKNSVYVCGRANNRSLSKVSHLPYSLNRRQGVRAGQAPSVLNPAQNVPNERMRSLLEALPQVIF